MKARRVDYYPADLIAGCATVLSAEELGVYWLVCSLIYDRGEPIENDAVEIAKKLRNTHWRTVRACIDRLLTLPGKLVLTDDAKLSQGRCHDELKRSLKRVASAIANGEHGGRPPKENSDLPKAPGFSGEKLSDTKHQTSPTSHGAKAPQGGNGRASRDDDPPGFAAFWSAYPKRSDRKDAVAAYRRVLKEATPDVLLAAAKRYAAERAADPRPKKVRDHYTKSPATFLNKGSWANEPEALPPQAGALVVNLTEATIAAHVANRVPTLTDADKAERARFMDGLRGNKGAA